jgi:predicted HicB family RNase H-like nuclease
MAGVPSLADEVAPSYRISLVRAGEGPDAPWLAEVDDFPDCSARADTPEEAVRLARIAADRSLKLSAAESEEPQPETAPRHSGRLLVRMPATLHDELAQLAERENVSLNQLITGVLAGAVEWRSADDDVPQLHTQTRPEAAGDKLMLSPRVARLAFAANFAVVLVAAVAAIALLVAAWQGW